MKKHLFFVFTLIAIGCKKDERSNGPFSTSKIVNLTEMGIDISIQYDKEEIDRRYGKNSYRLGTLGSEHYPQISYDSEKLISKVNLKPKDSLLIDYGNADTKFANLKKIIIHSPKNLSINNRNEMQRLFVEKGKHLFILEIK